MRDGTALLYGSWKHQHKDGNIGPSNRNISFSQHGLSEAIVDGIASLASALVGCVVARHHSRVITQDTMPSRRSLSGSSAVVDVVSESVSSVVCR